MSQRIVVPGTLLQKPAQAIPSTATGTLYTVAGGNVLITGMFGVVSTTLASTANLSLGTQSGGNAAIATAAALANNAAGTFIFPAGSGGKATALVTSGVPFVSYPPFILSPFVAPTGTITWTTSAAATGAVTWYLWYTPVDLSATVS